MLNSIISLASFLMFDLILKLILLLGLALNLNLGLNLKFSSIPIGITTV